MSAGVVLRVKEANADRVRELVGQVITSSCWQVLGKALWLDQGKDPELTKISLVERSAALDLHSDFGHIFDKHAELRWRRVDTDEYDVLILSDAPLTIEGADALGEGWMIEEDRKLIAQHGAERFHVRVAQYLAPNGAVQFVSYREVLR